MPTSVESRQQVQFAEYTLDLRTGELWCGGNKQPLPNQCFQILAALLEKPGEMVSREELVNRLWASGVFVDFEGNLNKAIKRLRGVLNDTAEQPRFIETLPRHGYRFIAPVSSKAGNPTKSTSLTGKKISHYRVLEVIGGGGMGMVYAAEDLKLDRRVALKFLPEELASDPVALHRFEREARTASALNHPNICTIYDVLEYESQPVLVMEFLEGETLRDHLATLRAEQKKLRVDDLVRIALAISAALQAAHEKNIIHRDIKPANIYLTNSEQVKILDFGLAKLLLSGVDEPAPDPGSMARTEIKPRISSAGESEAASEASGSQFALTRTGLALGTVGYMSPEQARGEKLDARSDLFSFGLVLYEMASGRRAFSGETAAQVRDAILHDSPVSLRELNSAVPAKLVSIIDKALEKDRERRYQTAADIRSDLLGLEAQRTRAGRLGLWFAIGAPVVLLLAIVAGLLLRGRFWRQLTPSAAMQNKSIAVLSFRNMSGDQSLNWLDAGLPELLTTDLSQVKGMDVLSREQVYRAIKRKGQQNATELPPDVALDVARDAGADACVTGSLMKLGKSKLRVDLHVQDTRTGKILFSDKVENEDINGIFTMVDAMTARIAERSLSATQLPASAPQIAGVMTSNLEAMRHYQAGEDYQRNAECEKAVGEFGEAVHLDPQFAMAYYRMEACYSGVGDRTRFVEAARMAEQLASRLPRVHQLGTQWWKAFRLGDADGLSQAAQELAHENPRAGFDVVYYEVGFAWPDDLDRAVALTREAITLDPNDPERYNHLAYLQAMAGHEAAALEAWHQFQAHAGANANVWDTHGDLLFTFGHDEEAVAADRRALEMDPDLQLRVRLALIYAEQGKYELAAEELNRYKQRKRDFYLLEFPAYKAELLQVEGKPEQSLALYAHQVRAFINLGETFDAETALLRYASLAFLLGKEQPALAFARQQSLPNKEEQISISILEAASGNEAGATAALQQYAEANPEVPARVIRGYRDWNTALLILRRADQDAAARVLPELKVNGSPAGFYLAFLIRGRIRLLANDHAGAERDFKTAIINLRLIRSFPQNLLTEQLGHFYLGQLYQRTGAREDAIGEYRKFLTPYANTNSRLPQIAEARAGLKSLHE